MLKTALLRESQIVRQAPERHNRFSSQDGCNRKNDCLVGLGGQIETVVKGVPGAVDVSMEQQADISFLTVELKRRAIARAD